MARFPTITTTRCILESFSERHLTDRYVSWLNDPDVVRYSEQRHKHHDLASCRTYVESFIDSPHYLIAIIARDHDLGHIGNISAYVDEYNCTADTGILLGHKQLWGQGYGSEAWEAVCRYLLMVKGVRKVAAGTSANNKGMLGIMRHVGMIDDGKRLRQLVIDEQEVDIVYSALFRDHFLRS